MPEIGSTEEDVTLTTTIVVVAAVLNNPVPLEGLWKHFKKTFRGQALRAAHQSLQRVLEHMGSQVPKAVKLKAGKHPVPVSTGRDYLRRALLAPTDYAINIR